MPDFASDFKLQRDFTIMQHVTFYAVICRSDNRYHLRIGPPVQCIPNRLSVYAIQNSLGIDEKQMER